MPDPSILDLCDLLGLCPACGYALRHCRCDEDAELVADATSHPAACLCCVERDPHRPARLWGAPVIDESASFVDSGAL